MNRNRTILKFLLSIFFILPAKAQQRLDTLELSTDISVFITFNTPINLFAPGNGDYAFKPHDNMLECKAKNSSARVTNLAVRTNTGIYVWYLKYAKNPNRVLIDGDPEEEAVEAVSPVIASSTKQNIAQDKKPNQTSFTPNSLNNKPPDERAPVTKKVAQPNIILEREKTKNRDMLFLNESTQNNMYRVIDAKQAYNSIAHQKDGIMLILFDVYVDKSIIYFKFVIRNSSSIAYDIDLLRFESYPKSTLKKRATDAAGVSHDIRVRESVTSILPDKEEHVVYGIDIFAFKETDILKVKLEEITGSRGLMVEIPANIILNAKSL